jgi:hypothetical protein
MNIPANPAETKIASLAAFLAPDVAAYTTGANFVADEGYTS